MKCGNNRPISNKNVWEAQRRDEKGAGEKRARNMKGATKKTGW
jgi:hypothetical protein